MHRVDDPDRARLRSHHDRLGLHGIAPVGDSPQQLAVGNTGCGKEDVVAGDDIFFAATGITNGELLRGGTYRRDSVQTESIVMRSKSGTIRVIDSVHQLGKLRAYSAVDFDLT